MNFLDISKIGKFLDLGLKLKNCNVVILKIKIWKIRICKSGIHSVLGFLDSESPAVEKVEFTKFGFLFLLFILFFKFYLYRNIVSIIYYLNKDSFSGRFAVGQNIARTWTSRRPGPYDSEPNWRRRITSWFNEVQHYQTGFSRSTGHYTQVPYTLYTFYFM